MSLENEQITNRQLENRNLANGQLENRCLENDTWKIKHIQVWSSLEWDVQNSTLSKIAF